MIIKHVSCKKTLSVDISKIGNFEQKNSNNCFLQLGTNTIEIFSIF
jgi:hypothetical protein